jgi:hypothetical protein
LAWPEPLAIVMTTVAPVGSVSGWMVKAVDWWYSAAVSAELGLDSRALSSGTDMKRPVKEMVPLVDGMVEPQRGLHAEAHEHAYGLTSRAGGGDRAARGVVRRAGTQWIGWPPH